jgi:hypothetical protein
MRNNSAFAKAFLSDRESLIVWRICSRLSLSPTFLPLLLFTSLSTFDRTGEKITEYKHPVNENIIFCDVPGLSMKFNQSKFQKMAKLTSYNYIFLFFESVLTVDDEWLISKNKG